MMIGEHQERQGRRWRIRYVYKPYHGWRHGYRRERWKKRIIRIFKFLLVLEGIIFAAQYVKANTSETVRKRIVFSEEMMEETGVFDGDGYDGDSEYYGIGVDMDKGMIFWFQRKTEASTERVTK